MAERRMFAKVIIDSDAFLDMPLSAQALYFHLSMNADDEGFVGNPKKTQRMVGASDDDFRLLMAKRFVLAFPSGVIAIKHWKINNYIQADRFRQTTYIEERATLMLDAKNAYTERIQNGYEADTECIQDVYNVDTRRIQNGYKMDTQVSIGKYSIVKSENSAYARESFPAHLFPADFVIDVEPTLTLSEYEALAKEYNISAFAKQTIKRLSKLEKHKYALLSGEWRDFKRKTIATDRDIISRGEQVPAESTFMDLNNLDAADVDI